MGKMDRNTIITMCLWEGWIISTSQTIKIVSCTIKKEIQVVSLLALERGKEDQQRLPVKVTLRVSSKEAKQAGKRQQGDCSKKSDSDLEI